MKANELRINNYLEYFMEDFENPWRVTQVDIDDIAYFVQYPNDTDYRPIPLTEEWLLKFGFVKGKGAFFIEVLKTEFYFRDSYTGGYYWGFVSNSDWNMCELTDVRPVNYVHQLQNLYFAITGEELTINEKRTKLWKNNQNTEN